MAYTYSGNPSSSLTDEVHFRLGNTDPSNCIATDEECAFALAEHRGNTYLAAAMLAESKGMEFLYKPSTVKRGERTVSYADMANHFLTLAKQLRNNASLATTTLYAGGLDVGEKEAERRDTSLTQPFASKHLHEQASRHGDTISYARED